MPIRLARFAPVFAVVALIGACGDDGDDQAPAEAAALWQKIHAIDYRSLPRAPGFPGRTPSSAPHGDAVEIYVNDRVTETLTTPGATAWPDGSLIVKDGWAGGSLKYVAAMEKRGGAWFWVEWSGDGDAKYSGAPSLCVNCHASGSDGVRAFGLPK